MIGSSQVASSEKPRSQPSTMFQQDHTYVVLSQQTPPPPSLSLPSELQDQTKLEQIEEGDEENSNSSHISIQGNQQKLGLLSKSRFSDLTLQIASALFYGICSFLITVINKVVLTSYGFPSSNILGVGQMVAIITILKVASLFRIVTVRRQSMRNKKLWTLAILYLCNLMTGLGGTKHLPLPMFIALRRFSIAMTAIGEFYLLHVKQGWPIIWTIVAMIGGSLIAAASDLTFNLKGYLLVMGTNFFTAANGVYTKKTIDSREINKHEILYYNALFTVVPLITISCLTNNMDTLRNYEHWSEIGFIISFITSCTMGYLLMYSSILCTHHNSALTTTIVGTLKVSSGSLLRLECHFRCNLKLTNLLSTRSYI